MFFDVLNNVLFDKQTDKIHDVDSIEQFSPYMLNRWASMHSKDMCHIINDTTNRYHSLFDDKETMYKMYIHLLPRVNKKYIKYIKKNKTENTKESEDSQDKIDALSSQLELSKKEISNYIKYDSEHRSTNTY